MEHYDITVAGVKRSLPVVPISDTLSIASFVIFGDTDVVEPCARELAAKLPPVDYLITAEAKSIPLIYEMAKVMKMPRYLIARKSVKGYMKNPIVTKVNSITTTREQILCLDEDDINLIKGSRMAIVDDVISTGSSLAAAITAGAVAQFLQWAVVEKNNQIVASREIKNYFVRGASRSGELTYPNREWGYGRLNVVGTFDALIGV